MILRLNYLLLNLLFSILIKIRIFIVWIILRIFKSGILLNNFRFFFCSWSGRCLITICVYFINRILFILCSFFAAAIVKPGSNCSDCNYCQSSNAIATPLLPPYSPLLPPYSYFLSLLLFSLLSILIFYYYLIFSNF